MDVIFPVEKLLWACQSMALWALLEGGYRTQPRGSTPQALTLCIPIVLVLVVVLVLACFPVVQTKTPPLAAFLRFLPSSPFTSVFDHQSRTRTTTTTRTMGSAGTFYLNHSEDHARVLSQQQNCGF
jgi:hypothetical protein